ncbi:glycosyltransferase family 2 protein [Crocinitomicaceae bacterium]|nr:glycosyltransferase family 2 protein [Crocinitomicaceae bacterium]
MNDLAIVILNWNGADLLETFLGKVVTYSADAQIIVADNASEDNSVAYIKAHYPTVEIVQNAQNGGFAKGYNDALKKVNSKFYLLLNSDIEVTENWLAPLYEKMQDPNVAGCQPKILSHKNKDTFEHAGAAGGFLDKNYFPFCRGRIFDHNEKDIQQYNSPIEVFWATGAALMIRSELYHKVGGFDEDFYAHMEEIDLCWRLKRHNYSFFVVPESIVYHVGGGTLPYSSPRKSYLNFRNSLMMIIKNHEGFVLPKLVLRMSIDGIAALRFLFRGELINFWAVFKAHMYQYAKMKTLLKKRKAIQAEATTFNKTGLFGGNIVWNYYVKGVKRFSQLNQRLFK